MNSFRIVAIILVLLCGVPLFAQKEDYPVSDNMTRSEMISQTPPLRLIRFSKSLSPDVQAKLWVTKINDTLSNAGLSEGEKKTIKLGLLPYLSAEAFGEGSKSKTLAHKSRKVGKKLKRKYHWDEEKEFKLLSNLYTLEEYKRYWLGED